MENPGIDFLENIAGITTFETQQAHFSIRAIHSPEEDDEEEDDNEREDDDQGGDKSKDSDNDNPPLDKDVVHSPLTTQPGGKPK